MSERMDRAIGLRRCLWAGMCAGTVAASVCGAQTIPAFPGAEGYGAHARGGRGGDVYTVTSLEASGAGSFAYGIQTAPEEGRTIVFAVSGHIRLPSGSGGGLTINKDKITVAGQTAPGDGICFWNNTMNIAGEDLVIRHIRWRYGKQAAGGDCVNIGAASANVIFDHCDMMFSTDENFSTFGGTPENMTFQWSCNAWGLNPHSCGGLWTVEHTSAHHTLWAHNHTRNIKAIRPRALDWANNVTFGWDLGFNMAGADVAGTYRINMRGCTFIHGAATTSAIYGGGTAPDNSVPFHLHMSDCGLDGSNNGLLDITRSNYTMVNAGAYNQTPDPFPQTAAADAAAPGDPVVGVPLATDDRLTAYKKVISQVGPLRMAASPTRPLRDEITALLVNDVVTMRRRIISDPLELGLGSGAFAALNSEPPPADGDADGMPDYWEAAVGFNPAVADHNHLLPSAGGILTGLTFFPTNTPAGYTRLEEYLHFKAIPHGVAARNLADQPSHLDVDLARYTSGFIANPVFTLSGVVGGTAVLQPDGHTLRFTPTLNYVGRGRFEFTVTDADGSAWTQTTAVIVSAGSVPRGLVWSGDGVANDWTLAAVNWLNGTNRTVFSDGDSLLFDDRGSASPAVSLAGALAPGSVTVNADQDYAFSGAGSLYGPMPLDKFGVGKLTVAVSNAYSGGTLISGGELRLANDTANAHGLGSGPITLDQGTLTQYSDNGTYNAATYDLVVPAGSTGTLNADGRVDLSGTLNGGGTLNVNAPWVRTTLYGNWSAFTGQLNLIDGGVRLGNLFGFPAASTHIAPGAAIEFSGTVPAGGANVEVGELSGGAGSELRGGPTGGGRVLTWQVGGLNTDAVFDGNIREQNADSTTAIRKAGSGAWTLSGSGHTYRGGTLVSNGLLMVNGVLGASFVTVSGGARLGGNGALRAGARVNAGGEVLPGDGGVGTLTVSNGLTLVSPNLCFDLSLSPAGVNDRIVLDGGLLTMAGTQNYSFNLVDGALSPGDYYLISGGINTDAAGVGFSHNLPTGTRQGFALQRPASGNGQCYTRLHVTGSPAALTWTGNDGGTWAVAGATDWANRGAPDRFYNLDTVLFDETSTNRNVTVTGAVLPASVTISNVGPYRLEGPGSIAGDARLIKMGSGVLTLAGSNSFHGGMAVYAGTVALANDTANAYGVGMGPVTLDGGALSMYSNASTYNDGRFHLVVPHGATGTLSTDSRCYLRGSLIGGGTLNVLVTWVRTDLYADWSAFTGHINLSADADGGELRLAQSYQVFGFPLASVHLGDKARLYHSGIVNGGTGTRIPIGALSGSGSSELLGGPTSGRVLTWVVGGRGGDASFAGRIREQAAGCTTALEKTGPGVWRLGGENTYVGGTTIMDGTLLVNNSTGSGTGSGNVAVESGAVLGGTGTVAGGVTLQAGAVLAPGDDVGGLAILGDLNLPAGAVLQYDLGASSDRIDVTGDLSLGGELHIADAGGLTYGLYTLITYTGALVDSGVQITGAPTNFLYEIDTSVTGLVRLAVNPLVPFTPFESWQIAHFGSTTNPDAFPSADPDGDGMDNAGEFRCGTLPTNRQSVLRIRSVGWEGHDLRIVWTTAGGRTNVVQAATTLRPHDFTDLSGPIAIQGSGDATADYVAPGVVSNSWSEYLRVRLEE